MAKIDDLDVKFPNKHSLVVEITEEMLHDHVTSAIEGGSRYWADIDVGRHMPGWANYFTASFTDIEDKTKYTLSIDKLLTGLAVLASKYPHHFCDIILEMGDATTGDVLIQCALLGDIVYG